MMPDVIYTTVNIYSWRVILFGAIGGKKKHKSQNYETVKNSFEFSCNISNKWTYILSMLAQYLYLQTPTFEVEEITS